MSQKKSGRKGPEFPCASLEEALKHLRRPPTPEAVWFKVSNRHRRRSPRPRSAESL